MAKENKSLVEIFSERPDRFKLAREGLIKAGIDENFKVLEIGCSFGDACLKFSNEFECNFIGIDINEQSINKAKEKFKNNRQDNRVSFLVGDAINLPVLDKSVDRILSEAAFSLLEDKEKVVKEYCRVLKSSGKVIINDFIIRGSVDDEIQNNMVIPCFKGMKRTEEYTNIFERNGFKLVYSQDFSKEIFKIALHLKNSSDCDSNELNGILWKASESVQDNKKSKNSDYKAFFRNAKIGYIQLIYQKSI